MRDYRNIKVDRIKVEVWVKIEMFKHGLCEGVMSPLTECFMGIDIMPDWGTLLSTVKPKPVDEIQMEVAIRNVRLDGIKVRVWT